MSTVDPPRRVLITGVAGFLGSRLAARLGAAGWEVSGTVLCGEQAEVAARTEQLDVRDRGAARELVAELDPQAIVHLAALSHVGSSWQRIADHFATNVVGTDNVIEAAAGRRLLFASSAEVYGDVARAEQPLAEGRSLAPGNPYAFGKAVAERAVCRAGGVVVRCFNVVGPGQAPSFALPTFARQLVAIRAGSAPPRLAVGNLEAVRDFVPVDDAIAGLTVALEAGASGAVYNLASGVPRSLRAVVERLIELAGVEVSIEVDPERLRPADVAWLEGDAGALRALGWSPSQDLDAALRGLLDEAELELEGTTARGATG